MAKEIERKFLISGEFKHLASKKIEIKQGYLSSVPERSVRIRITNEQAFLTIKGITNKSGTTRFEWEKELNIEEAKELFELCEPGAIEKTRYIIPVGKHNYEVDEFHKENSGLIVAEIELSKENETFLKPVWLGKEVTGDNKYFNSQLSINPYSKWDKNNL